MTGRTFAILTLAGFLSMLVATKIGNQYMVISSFVLMLLPFFAAIKQSEIR